MAPFRIILLAFFALCSCTLEFQTHTIVPIREVEPRYCNEMPSILVVLQEVDTIIVDSFIYTSVDTAALRKGDWIGLPLKQSEWPEPMREIRKAITYPEVARRNNIEGSVRCRFLIGKDGKVQRTLMEKSDSPIFGRVVEEAIYKTGFTPKYFKKKIPQRVLGTATFTFKLKHPTKK